MKRESLGARIGNWKGVGNNINGRSTRQQRLHTKNAKLKSTAICFDHQCAAPPPVRNFDPSKAEEGTATNHGPQAAVHRPLRRTMAPSLCLSLRTSGRRLARLRPRSNDRGRLDIRSVIHLWQHEGGGRLAVTRKQEEERKTRPG